MARAPSPPRKLPKPAPLGPAMRRAVQLSIKRRLQRLKEAEHAS